MNGPDQNIAELVLRHAATNPDRICLVVATEWDDEAVRAEDRLTYGELAGRVASMRARLRGLGLGPEDRVLLAFPLSLDFYALALAVLAEGAAVVLVDAGMSRTRVVSAIAGASPTAMFAAAPVMRLARFVPALGRIPIKIAAGAAGGTSTGTGDAAVGGAGCEPVRPRGADDHAFITFTSGSTGSPKGADRTHGLLQAQHRAIAAALPYTDDDVNMAPYPVLVLHDMMCGITSVLPPLDFSKGVGSIQPGPLLDLVERWHVTQLGGAPAFLEPVVAHVMERGRAPAHVRRVASGGGPVPARLMEAVAKAFPAAEGLVLYGATEAEPMARISMADVLEEQAGEEAGSGYLVGPPVPEIDLEIVDPATPPALGPAGIAPHVTATDRWGEVVVAGTQVLTRYWRDAGADAASKLVEQGGRRWHRTGDVARRDAAGRLWLGGRVADAVELDGATVHPYTVEGPINAIPGVVRSALVSHRGAPAGELCIELADTAGSRSGVVARVRSELARAGLASTAIVVVDTIAVDGRHNTKVDRLTLRARREHAVLAERFAARTRRAVAVLLDRLPAPATDWMWSCGAARGGAS